MLARVVLACALVVSAATLTRPALGQVAPGEIVITVTDAVSKAPIDNAEVFLLGGTTPISSLTDEKGQLTFPQMAVGTYSITIERDGYRRADVADVEVLEGQRVKVAVALEPALKIIAVVTAHPNVSISTESINANSATRQISQSLKNALNMLAGVSVDDTTYGPNSGFSVSLSNHDASQTGVSINGIRIAGSASGLLGGGQGLFDSAEVSFAPTAGYIGGTVNFQTILPSKLWTYNVTNELGNYGAQTESQSATGSKGKLAFGLQHDYTSRDAFQSGMTYADQSGQDYLHLAGNRGTANLFEMTYSPSSRISVSATGIFENSNFSTICSTFTTLVPCGLGPGLANKSYNDFGTLRANVQAGNVALGLFEYGNVSHYVNDDPTRSIGGVVSPFRSDSASSGGGIGGEASITAKRHTYSLNLSSAGFGGDFTTTYDGVPTDTTQPRQRTSEIDITDAVKSNDRIGLTHGLSFASASGAGAAFELSEKVDWKPTSSDSFEGLIGL
ncbi:MAG TPA: TonB-dependent receptor, partial [Candidatus Baltobacteraceae bacterium]